MWRRATINQIKWVQQLRSCCLLPSLSRIISPERLISVEIWPFFFPSAAFATFPSFFARLFRWHSLVDPCWRVCPRSLAFATLTWNQRWSWSTFWMRLHQPAGSSPPSCPHGCLIPDQLLDAAFTIPHKSGKAWGGFTVLFHRKNKHSVCVRWSKRRKKKQVTLKLTGS